MDTDGWMNGKSFTTTMTFTICDIYHNPLTTWDTLILKNKLSLKFSFQQSRILLQIQYFPPQRNNFHWKKKKTKFESFNISENNIISVKAAKLLWYLLAIDFQHNIRVIRKVRKTHHQHITRTLSLVIHRVRFLKNLEKSTLAFNAGWNSENHQLWW
jgi:hypothetical protein